MPRYQEPKPLEPGKYYHIFNRGVNRENIFIEERNYRYFLDKYALYIEPVAETFAYCLLKNHFHLMIRVKVAPDYQHLTGLGDLSGENSPKAFNPSQAFSNFFNSYSRTINQAYGRTGSLFQRPFGRIEINSENYFSWLVHYIHFNPQNHGFCDDYTIWPHSSYHAILSEKASRIRKTEVLEWFGGKEAYRQYHDLQAGRPDMDSIIGDDVF